MRIAFVTRPFSATTVDARKAAAAMAAHDLPVSRHLLHAGNVTDVKFARHLTAGRPYDAVICTNDHAAAQLLQSLTRIGVKVPRQLRLVGFDDVRFATLLTVPLTTIHQPCRDIAVIAFNAMRERLADPSLPPRHLALTPRLIVRDSCGAYAARRWAGRPPARGRKAAQQPLARAVSTSADQLVDVNSIYWKLLLLIGTRHPPCRFFLRHIAPHASPRRNPARSRMHSLLPVVQR